MKTATRTEMGPAPQQFSFIPLDRIRESPLNPRKTFDDGAMVELIDSVRQQGVVVPVLVRPRGDDYELVYGHRRLRAAAAAGLAALPATIRELTDREVLELALIENCTRQDIHPLEEGAAYRELHETHGFSVEEIAAKVGKSTGTIYARMKLCSLGEEGRAALLAGKLDASLALLVARIPNEGLQAEATKALLEMARDGEPPRYRWAAEELQRRFMLRLAEAPFDPRDPTLVPAVGACTTCPKRSGAQPELFADVKGADVCTDTACFAQKRDAHWQEIERDAAEKGAKVLTAKQAKDVFKYGNSRPDYNSEYVDLDDEEHVGGKARSYRQLAKKAGVELEVTFARDPNGGIHELVSRKAAKALARKAEPPSAPAQPSSSSNNAALEREKAKRDLEREVERRAIGLIADAAEKKGLTDDAWRALFSSAVEMADLDEFAKRRGLEPEDNAVRAAFTKAKVPGRLAMLLELALDDWPNRDQLGAIAKSYRVDLKKLAETVKAEAKQKAKDAAPGKTKPKKGKAKKTEKEG